MNEDIDKKEYRQLNLEVVGSSTYPVKFSLFKPNHYEIEPKLQQSAHLETYPVLNQRLGRDYKSPLSTQHPNSLVNYDRSLPRNRYHWSSRRRCDTSVACRLPLT